MATAQVAADITRPGTSYYVPGVRISRLSRQLPTDGVLDAGTEIDRDIRGDILQVQVTRVSSGPSQYKLVLNNWYLSTATDRAHETDEFTRLGARETIDGQTGVWPRFKYNDFSLLAFGDRLRIDMRYMPEPAGDEAQRKKASKAEWVPMVAGPITDMRFTFGASEGARLEISGEDDLSMLQDKLTSRKAIEGRGELNIVRQALVKGVKPPNGYPLKQIAKPLVNYPEFATDNGQGLREAIQAGQSVLDFVQKLAERLDFEVFLEFANLDDAGSLQEFHFEPCRARALATGFRLARRNDPGDASRTSPLLDSACDQARRPVLGGPGPRPAPRAVPGRARPREGAAHNRREGAARGGDLKSAGEVRECFFGGRTNCHTIQNQSNMDPVRADWYAEAVIRRKAREFFTIDATTLGQPRLRPGQHVEVSGMRIPFDGFYYVTRVVTTYGADGMRTKITASRPGMALPPGYPCPRTS